MWGNVEGYIWGKTNQRIEVPMTNQKDRQTYYGAVNYKTGQFILMQYPYGNGSSTVSFIKELYQKASALQLLLIWDGVSYHTKGEMKNYLKQINQALEEKDWKVTCLLFAPHAPEQNPVEDIWLQGKTFLRRNFYQNKTFAQIKKAFFNFLNKRTFSFPKLSQFGT